MKHDLKSRRLLCDALNKLFWKCPIGVGGVHSWAEYWLGELRDGPDNKAINGIKWDRENELFVPCRERRG